MSEAGGQEEDDAARAFDALRGEVASLRRGIELLYRQGQEAKAETKSVDYSLTLGQISKALQAVQGRLEAIEGTPALAMTPEVYRDRIGAAGRVAGEIAAKEVREAAVAQNAAARDLREIIGQARTKREQRAWVVSVGTLGVMVGVLLWFLLIVALPWGGGTWLASLPLAGGNRWQAGQVLLGAGDPVGFERIVKLSQACGDQQVDFCAAAIAVKGAAGEPAPAGARHEPRP